VFEKDRQRFVSARGALRLLLARYLNRGPDRIVFRYGPHGKPALAGEPTDSPDLRFNVSHSGDYCLCAVTVSREVGVDVELVRPDVECLQLAERFFTRREYEDLLQQPEEARRTRFFRYWTCKEAYLKTRGIGISSGMARLDVTFSVDGSVGCWPEDGASASQPHCLVRSLPIADHVVAAVAAEGSDWEVALSHYSVK
jgi:4'-phosphopantetheinyl transferase